MDPTNADQQSSSVPVFVGGKHRCFNCGNSTITESDKFCRQCGCLLLLNCSKCSKSVRPADKFCAHCGKRRWQLYEQNKDTLIKVGIVLGVVVCYGILHAFVLKRSKH